MPNRTGYLSRLVVAPNLTDADVTRAAEFYTFDEITGRAGWIPPKTHERHEAFMATLRFIPFTEFAGHRTELTRTAPAFVCRAGFQVRFMIDFIWDDRNDASLRQALSESRPCRWPGWEQSQCYLFGEQLMGVSEAEWLYSEDEIRLLFLEAADKERRKYERLKARFDQLAGAPVKYQREVIPEEVRMYVWRRDGGQCTQCGSKEKLEYDHIIPVSRGGSSTERNIQLLCEPCNRRKSDSI